MPQAWGMEFSKWKESGPAGKVVSDALGLTRAADLDWVIYSDTH